MGDKYFLMRGFDSSVDNYFVIELLLIDLYIYSIDACLSAYNTLKCKAWLTKWPLDLRAQHTVLA